MGQRKPPGLIKIGRNWHIDKKVRGYGRICESCKTDKLEEAIEYLNHRLEEMRHEQLYGSRPITAPRRSRI